jgi:hypothetical protein
MADAMVKGITGFDYEKAFDAHSAMRRIRIKGLQTKWLSFH